MSIQKFLQAKSIVSTLVHSGFIAYFAGGWVRDFVMGHPSEDIDIATDASPAQIMELFPRTLLVGIAFGVVIVIMGDEQFEVATFRKDLEYLDGRHPTAIEASNPFEDAMRRDFTINGMFYDPLEEKIHDFVHGREDIRRGVIRTIGDPHERFYEDRLRMLRAFRFSSRFSFSIDIETQEAIREHADKIFPAVAMERVWQEFNKMAVYPRFDQAIVEMHRLGLLDVIFPEIIDLHIKELRHRVNAFASFPPNTPTILYLMEIISPLSLLQKVETAKRLTASNKEIKWVEYMEKLDEAVINEMKGEQYDPYIWVHLFASFEWDLGIKVLAARYASNSQQEFYGKFLDRFNQVQKHVLRVREGKPVVTAAMLMQWGIAPGKKMGVLLKDAEQMAVRTDCEEPEPILARLMM